MSFSPESERHPLDDYSLRIQRAKESAQTALSGVIHLGKLSLIDSIIPATYGTLAGYAALRATEIIGEEHSEPSKIAFIAAGGLLGLAFGMSRHGLSITEQYTKWRERNKEVEEIVAERQQYFNLLAGPSELPLTRKQERIVRKFKRDLRHAQPGDFIY